MKRFPLLIMALLTAVAFLSVSCEKDPVKPRDENHDHLHDDPVRMTVELIECHLHSDWERISTNGGPHANPQTPARYLKRRQQITYKITPNGWKLADGSQKKFYVQQSIGYKIGSSFTPAPVYLMYIHYYNNKGQLMNEQLCTGGQEHIHQHFFSVEDVHPTFDGKAETDDNQTVKQLDYVYADTTPWNETHHSGKARLTGKENPIGMKGVIRFLRDRKEMNLRIRLYHGFEGKMNQKTQTFSPWYQPSTRLLQKGEWDVNVLFPVVVFWSRNDFIDIEQDADITKIPENSLDEDSNRTAQSIMHTFGISWTEALQDYYNLLFRAEGMESSQIWL